MDTATIIQIIEGIVLICVTLGLGVVAKFYANTKKLVEMIQEFLASAAKAKEDGVITKEESDGLVDQLCALMKQGKLVLDDILALKEQLTELLAKKAAAAPKEPVMVKVPKGEGPAQ